MFCTKIYELMLLTADLTGEAWGSTRNGCHSVVAKSRVLAGACFAGRRSASRGLRGGGRTIVNLMHTHANRFCRAGV